MDTVSHGRTVTLVSGRRVQPPGHLAATVRPSASTKGIAVRVLVVSEDAKERLRAVSALHLLDDVDVDESTSAPDARLRLSDADEAFDVLVVDGDLYPRGGYALLYDLRAHAELSGKAATPALVMTSRAQDAWLAGWAGANDLLLKPVDPFELARRVGALQGARPVPYGDHGAAAAQVAAATRSHGVD